MGEEGHSDQFLHSSLRVLLPLVGGWTCGSDGLVVVVRACTVCCTVHTVLPYSGGHRYFIMLSSGF